MSCRAKKGADGRTRHASGMRGCNIFCNSCLLAISVYCQYTCTARNGGGDLSSGFGSRTLKYLNSCEHILSHSHPCLLSFHVLATPKSHLYCIPNTPASRNLLDSYTPTAYDRIFIFPPITAPNQNKARAADITLKMRVL